MTYMDAEGAHLRVPEGETYESVLAEAVIRLALYEQAEEDGMLEWIGTIWEDGEDV